jgi:hypothetical protein
MPSYEIRIARRLPQAAVVYVKASNAQKAFDKGMDALKKDRIHFYTDEGVPRNPADTVITDVIDLYQGGESPRDTLTAEYLAWTKDQGLSSEMCASELLCAIESVFLFTNPLAKVWHAWLVDFIERWEHADVNT